MQDSSQQRPDQGAQSQRLSKGRSRRYYHAPLFMVPDFESLQQYLPYLKERNYSDILLTPFCTPTFEKNGDKEGGSPYAFADARMNPRYTNGKQLSLVETVEGVRSLVGEAKEKDIGVFFDVALNHVGHKPVISKKNPVFRDLHRDIKKGKITFDEIFCRPDEKRNPGIAGDWTDVRELRMNTDEEIDNAIKYFAKPYLSYIAACARPKGKKTPVNVRLDAPHMLPPGFWKKFAPIMVEILSGEDGTPPEILLETIDPLHHYQGIYDAFPSQAKPCIRHMNYQSHFSIVGNGTHPYHQLYEIEVHDKDYFWHGIHNKGLTNTGVALINCTHDATDDNQQTTKSRLERFQLNKEDFVICRRLFNAVTQLSSPEIIRMHTDDGNDFHSQKSLFSAVPLRPEEVTSEESYSFSKDLNAMHKALHDEREYAWYSAAHVWGNPQCMLHIAREEAGGSGNPTLTFINASNGTVHLPEGKSFAELLEDTYARKCGAKLNTFDHNPNGGSDMWVSGREKTCIPRQINLLGKFSDEQVRSLTMRYGEVFVNGFKVIDITKSFNAGLATGTYGTHSAAHYSPNPT